ncbi:hypothetical protein LguiA_013163 [Lonicera macranthoides]
MVRWMHQMRMSMKSAAILVNCMNLPCRLLMVGFDGVATVLQVKIEGESYKLSDLDFHLPIHQFQAKFKSREQVLLLQDFERFISYDFTTKRIVDIEISGMPKHFDSRSLSLKELAVPLLMPLLMKINRISSWKHAISPVTDVISSIHLIQEIKSHWQNKYKPI